MLTLLYVCTSIRRCEFAIHACNGRFRGADEQTDLVKQNHSVFKDFELMFRPSRCSGHVFCEAKDFFESV